MADYKIKVRKYTWWWLLLLLLPLFFLLPPLPDIPKPIAEKEEKEEKQEIVETEVVEVVELSCNQPIKSGNGTSGEMYFQLGSQNYDFELSYKMHGHPDEIIVYCGKGTGGEVLFRKMIEDDENSPQYIHFDSEQCDSYITITIQPEGNQQTSSWEFSISCP